MLCRNPKGIKAKRYCRKQVAFQCIAVLYISCDDDDDDDDDETIR